VVKGMRTAAPKVAGVRARHTPSPFPCLRTAQASSERAAQVVMNARKERVSDEPGKETRAKSVPSSKRRTRRTIFMLHVVRRSTGDGGTRDGCRQSTSLTLTTSLSHFPNSHDFPKSRELGKLSFRVQSEVES
jgi:hypothetical protein